jgi:photosynthetic reaction center L subunit
MLREVEICRKLGMGYHVPFAFWCGYFWLRYFGGHTACFDGCMGTWLSLRNLQPPGLGVQRGLPVFALSLQPRTHDCGEFLFCQRALHCHCTVVWFCLLPTLRAGETVRTPEHEDTFFRDIIGYSIGTSGIHRLGLFLALAAVLFSALCIVIERAFLDAKAGLNGGAGG